VVRAIGCSAIRDSMYRAHRFDRERPPKPERHRPGGVRRRRCRSRTPGVDGAPLQGRLQSQNRGADVFLADERRHYLGRTCSWKVCRPGVRASCDALHCGRHPYLHDDLATIRLPDSLIAAPLLELWPVVVRRCEVPADVEQMVSRLQQPHNPAVERTVGSHSLAAAAHRER